MRLPTCERRRKALLDQPGAYRSFVLRREPRRARQHPQVLARGLADHSVAPVGGELDWLDDGTIVQALRARRPV